MSQYSFAIVLGGSSGIGAELVKQLAATGCKVLAVGRDKARLEALKAAKPDRIEILVQDLTSYTAGDRTPIAKMAEGLGGLDLVIWAAGIMPEVGPDEFDPVKDTQMVTTNFTAAVAWLDEVATRFQAEGKGTIVGLGSVAGDRGRKAQPAYNASKAGFHTYMEALRNRLTRKGVTVVTIRPGPIDTPMTTGLGFKNMMPADVAASKILAKSSKVGDHYLKFSHRAIFGIIRAIPSTIFRRLDI